ncbi:TetR/AcrR family transcriptional regulator [Actinomadura macrotermitis]|uniref:HTH-type transcriptional regulator BetI n=1 Tax=Actinomadura macrotermitis TaxID=2585200 RepID=A0A7K0C5Z4_9ACTN|nr:TetR family transcriptional regulator C-terminal domain-containing protein [Actinomadura macrotermitis]MQY08853.1 HTH-type transcriptional regulator BetI [Actinomadura macrotermitis]
MPKIVDPEARRRQVAEAVFRVARRDGLEQASLRTVAAEAGLAVGSVRHYFDGQADLMIFAMRHFAERAGDRILERAGALRVPDPAAPPAAHAAAMEALLGEVLPLDDERREETEVWLAFITSARTRPELRPYAQRLFDGLREILVKLLATAQRLELLRPGLDLEVEAVRLGALLDGLAAHGVLYPDRAGPADLAAALRRHLCEITVVGPDDLPPVTGAAAAACRPPR